MIWKVVKSSRCVKTKIPPHVSVAFMVSFLYKSGIGNLIKLFFKKTLPFGLVAYSCDNVI